MHQSSLPTVAIFTASVLALAAPALADSYAQLYVTNIPSGSMDLWCNTTTPSGYATVQSGTADQYQMNGYDTSGRLLGTVSVLEGGAASGTNYNYYAQIEVDEGGVNYLRAFEMNPADEYSVAVNYEISLEADSGSPTGYSIGATVWHGSTANSTGWHHLSALVGTSFGQGNVTDLFGGCNYDNYTTHSYSGAQYYNAGTWSPWPNFTYSRTSPDSSCPTNASTSGTLSGGGTGTLSVTS